MKRILVIIIICLFSLVVPVYAKEQNRLYFTENDGRLYYESKLEDENLFMKHLDMEINDSFVDELVIENNTTVNYTLYFQIRPRTQSEEADMLLDYISMKIYLDDELIYDGLAKGLDYSSNGINLQDVIKIKKCKPNETYILRAETSLLPEYSDTEQEMIEDYQDGNTKYHQYSRGRDITTYIDWAFYAQYDDGETMEIVQVPYTGQNAFPIKIVAICFIIIGLGVIIYEKNKKE